jgi:peptidoglycan/xylan/chitin deacetylase (PgdA/CDA1 family)
MTNVHILRYHDIAPVMYDDLSYRAGNLINHLSFLRSEGFQSISCNDLYEHIFFDSRLPESPILLSFDNGLKYYSQFTAQALLKAGIGATFFICGENALRSSFKDRHHFDNFMDVDDLRQMSDMKFELALHSFTNTNFNNLSLTEIRKDIETNLEFFKKFSIKHSKVFAFNCLSKRFTFNRFKSITYILQEFGITLAFMGNGKSNLAKNNVYRLKRISVSESDSVDRLKKLLHPKRFGWTL